MSGEKTDVKRKSKGLTWAEASMVVLERADCPMTHKQILKVIKDEKLRDVSRSSSSLACLNAMLHHHSRGPDALFYKVDGRNSCYGMNQRSDSGTASATTINTVDSKVDIPTTSSSSSTSTLSNHLSVQSSDSEPSSPQQLLEPMSDTPAPTNVEPAVECPDPVSVVEVPDIQREETLSCASPTEKDSTAFQPKSATAVVNAPPKRSRPLSKSSKKDKRKLPDAKPQSGQPPLKKPRSSSTRPRPVAKTVLKNLKVGTVGEMNESQSLGENKMKKLTNPGMSASVDASVNGEAQAMPQIAAARNMVKFSGLHTKKQRRYKKMSVADQIKRTKEGRVDLQSPESILASVPLRSLLNNRTFQLLPPAYQYQLLMLLPKVDRIVGQDGGLRPSTTAFTNEFFTSTCHLWRDRLKDGEFTPEMQQKLKMEEERLTKIDPWKAKFFEPVWGQKSLSRLDNNMLPQFPGLTPETDNGAHVSQFWQPPSLVDRSLTNAVYSQSTVSSLVNSEQFNNRFMPQLAVPLPKLQSGSTSKSGGSKHKQMRVGPLQRSEAAKSLSSKAKAKISAVSMVLTSSMLSNALSVIQTSEPEDVLPVIKLLTRKKVLKIPIVETTPRQRKVTTKTKLTHVTPTSKSTEDINPSLTLNSLSVCPPQPVSHATINFSRDPLYVSKSETTSRPLSSLLPSNANTINTGLNALIPKNCGCRMKAMKVCRMCGAFCHDDCITAAQLCSMCVN